MGQSIIGRSRNPADFDEMLLWSSPIYRSALKASLEGSGLPSKQAEALIKEAVAGKLAKGLMGLFSRAPKQPVVTGFAAGAPSTAAATTPGRGGLFKRLLGWGRKPPTAAPTTTPVQAPAPAQIPKAPARPPKAPAQPPPAETPTPPKAPPTGAPTRLTPGETAARAVQIATGEHVQSPVYQQLLGIAQPRWQRAMTHPAAEFATQMGTMMVPMMLSEALDLGMPGYLGAMAAGQFGSAALSRTFQRGAQRAAQAYARGMSPEQLRMQMAAPAPA